MNKSQFISLVLSFLFIFGAKVIVPPITYANILKSNQLENPSEYGGTLTIGEMYSSDKINPLFVHNGIAVTVQSLLFDSLVNFSKKTGEISPCLADTWEISDDELEYVFYLKKNVRFHDGEIFTVDDVLFSFEKYKDKNIDSFDEDRFGYIKSIEKLSDYSFKVILFEPVKNLLERFAFYSIVPEHLLKDQDIKKCTFNYSPIGTGPFKFVSWDREKQQVILAANSSYFDGRPFLDFVRVFCYDDSTALMSAMMRSEVDLVSFINYEDYVLLKKYPDFKTHATDAGLYYAMAYDVRDSIMFDDYLRRAIAYGLDRKQIGDMVFGEVLLTDGPIHPDYILDDRGVQFEYNPTKAKLELLHRGWKDKDGDGVLEKGGKNLELSLVVNKAFDADRKMASIIRQQLSEIGIKVIIQLWDFSQMGEKVLPKSERPRAWLRMQWGVGLNEYVTGDIKSIWKSFAVEQGNIFGYRNDKIDRILSNLDELNSMELDNIYRDFQETMQYQQPVCFLFYPFYFRSVSAKFQGNSKFFDRYFFIDDIRFWKIKK
jgi:peptide/nickel transport system substrate-binding protein